MDARRTRDVTLGALALAVMAAFAGLHVFAPELPSLRRLELSAFDAQMRWRGARAPGPETVVVMIDDRTIADLGRWPVPRARFAEIVDKLHRAGAKVIGIDVLISEPAAGDGDAALASAIAVAGNVVLPFTFEFAEGSAPRTDPLVARSMYASVRHDAAYRPVALEATGLVRPLAALAEGASLGHMLAAFDVDGAPRYDYPAFAYDLDPYPSMAVRIVQRFLDVAWNDVVVTLGSGVAIGPLRVPTDAQMRLIVNYLGPAGAFPTHSFSHVLRGDVPDEALRGRIVLIGANATGSRDTFKTPFTGVLPGVERLATVVDAMLHQTHVTRPALAPWLEILAMLAGAVALAFAVSRLPLAIAAIAGVALAAAFPVSAQLLLSHSGIWQASAVPVVAVATTFLVLSLYRYGLLDKERRHLRRVFQRYLAPPMVDRLMADPKLPELGGELRELTILFCDLRGFTSLSERLEPPVLTRMLNQFLSAATDAILEHGGTVDKYVGDCVMAFWNAPVAQPDHVALACRAALKIVGRLDELNAQWLRERDWPPLGAGVGINTGPCTVGNFGSRQRFDYSAIGDAVNVAARLEAETRAHDFPILLGPVTAARATRFATLPLGPLHLRGRVEPLEVHALVGDEAVRDSEAFRARYAAHVGASDPGGAQANVAAVIDTPHAGSG